MASTVEFARTWGRMKANRSEEMNYEKVSLRKEKIMKQKKAKKATNMSECVDSIIRSFGA